MTSLYRQILLKSWQITKKFAYLWPLGLLAAFLGNGGEYQILFKESGVIANQPNILSSWKENIVWFVSNFDVKGVKIIFFLLIIVVTVALLLFFLWLIVSSFGGLIKGAALAKNGEKSKYGQLLMAGSKNVKPLLGLVVLAKIIVYGFLVLILGPLMLTVFGHNSTVNLLIVIVSFLIFVPLSIIVSLVTKYAAAYVMLSGFKFWDSFKMGWRLFYANWLISLEMAFILFIINILVGLAYIIVSTLIFAPFFLFAFMNLLKSPQTFDLLIYICVTLLLAISAFVGAWLATFQISSWTFLFLRLNEGDKVYSKIVRWAAAWPDKFKK